MKWIVIVSLFVVVYIGMYVHHIIARYRIRHRMCRKFKLRRVQMFNEMSERLYRFTGDDIWLYRL